MAYVCLFRQYRPQRFEEVYGQEHVTRTLQNAIRMGRTGQAYLFTGPRGVGKTTVARILAKALNCETGPTAEPCGTCDSCRRISHGSSLSVIEIDAASNRSIEDIRSLREDVQFAPTDGRVKVYILDEVHQITPAAFEAFLKTLEEPPAHALFVLATTESQKVPATIRSRCQRFDFRRVGLDDIVARLAEVADAEHFAADPTSLHAIARASDGSLRDALSLLDQIVAYAGETITAADVEAVLGILDSDTRFALGDVLAAEDAGAALGWLNALLDAGRDPRLLVDEALGHFRLLLLARLGCAPDSLKTLPPEVLGRLQRQGERYSPPRLMRIIEGWAACDKALRWHTQPRILLEVTLLAMVLDEPPAARPETPRREPAEPPRRREPVEPEYRAPEPPPVRERRPPAPPPEPEYDEPDTAPAPEPEPEPEPDLVAPPLGQGQELDVLAVRDRWPRFIEKIREGWAPLMAHLVRASVQRVEGDEIVLGFGAWEQSLTMCQRPQTKERIEQTLSTVLGRPVRFRGELVTEQASARSLAEFEELGPEERLDLAEQAAREIFPGALRTID